MNPLRPHLNPRNSGTGRIRAALVLIGECLACAAIFGTAWLFMLIGYGFNVQ